MAKPKTAKRYTPEYCEQLVKLHRAGRGSQASIDERASITPQFGVQKFLNGFTLQRLDRDGVPPRQ